MSLLKDLGHPKLLGVVLRFGVLTMGGLDSAAFTDLRRSGSYSCGSVEYQVGPWRYGRIVGRLLG